MSGSGRGAGFAVVTSAFAVVVAALVIAQAFQSGALLGEAGERQKANSRSYSAHAKEEISKCPVTDLARYTECVVKIIEATNEEQRSERDLVAQIKMGEWAFWMVLISALVAAVTALGVWWVKRTLDATLIAAKAAQEAVSVTREIGQAQSRAYISLDFCKVALERDPVRPILKYKITNSGQSPAFDIGFGICIITPTRRGKNPDVVVREATYHPVYIRSGNLGVNEAYPSPEITLGDVEIKQDAITHSGTAVAFVMYEAVFWRDIFNRQHTATKATLKAKEGWPSDFVQGEEIDMSIAKDQTSAAIERLRALREQHCPPDQKHT